ncbi:MAG: hypothetical protein R3F14_21480 [Polyangiaceae bacterium]
MRRILRPRERPARPRLGTFDSLVRPGATDAIERPACPRLQRRRLADAVSIDGRDNVLRFHAGTGSGLAGGWQVLPATSSLYNPQGGAALDYDGDNDLDIAYVAQGGSSVVIALNNGLGGFTGGPTRR